MVNFRQSFLFFLLFFLISPFYFSQDSEEDQNNSLNIEPDSKKEKPKQSMAKLVKVNSPIKRYLDWLFIEQGRALPPQVYPMSYEQLRYTLKTYIDYKTLSPLGKRLYDEIWQETEKDSLWGVPGWVAIDPVIGVNAQFYMGFPSLQESRDWYLHSYIDRPAFVDLGAEVSLFNRVYIETTAHIKQDITFIDANPNSYFGNIITDFNSIYAMMPQDAYASIAFDHVNIQGGKTTHNWGNGRSGNLLLSNAPGELDYLEVSTWWKWVNFTAMWTFLDHVSPAVDPETGEVIGFYMGSHYYAQAAVPEVVQPAQFFLLHRLDLKMGPRMNLIFTEAVIYKDYWKNVAFLNPLFMFHNWYLEGHADYFLSIDVEIALTPRWQLYTQILLDQVAVVGMNRSGHTSESSIPGAIPFLIGTEVVTPFESGYLIWTFEFLKIDPYAYLDRSDSGLFFDKRWLSSYAGSVLGEIDFVITQRVPLGYYLGNDLIRFYSELRWENPNFYNIWIQQSLLFQGEKNILTEWSDAKGEASQKAPSGNYFIQWASSVGGELSFSRWLDGQQLSLVADLTLINTWYSYWKVECQIGFGLNYKF